VGADAFVRPASEASASRAHAFVQKETTESDHKFLCAPLCPLW